jgi:hypothetical protein
VDKKEFEIRAGRLQEIAKVLEKLPAEVRSDAFDLLEAYVTEHSSVSSTKQTPVKEKVHVADGTEEDFFGKFDHDKPADNVRLIAACFYREYGVEPFSLEEVRQKASEVGITIPARVDMTLTSAVEKGKKLFVRTGTSKFKPTVHGEANLKETYQVKKGTKNRVQGTE